MSGNKKLALTALVLIALLGVLGAGTFATFTAQVNNPSNNFATGTLVISNKVDSGTACLSTGGGGITTNVADCDTLYDLSVKRPGDSGSANVTIKNEGSLDTSVFKLFSSACTNADAAGESYHGTGNPCSKIQLYVQQWTSGTFSTPSACLYGGAVVANTCDFSDTTKTLSDFAGTYNNSTNGIDIASLASGASAYFTVAVKLPSSADNTFQGRAATIDFSWYAQ